jgi:signal transduction histidine kinase
VAERLSTLARGVLPAFAERLRAQGVTLEVALPETLPAVRLDPMKFEQVLVELISNALDAMPEGGRLVLSARPAMGTDGAAGLVLEVRDTGRGITPEALVSVGQPFFTTRPEGTGLGLATARRFVEQHGGRLDLASEVGRGTAIEIWLPL